MTSNPLNRWLKPFSASNRGPRRGRRSRSAFRPGAESLERRLALSTVTWVGGADDPNWSDPLNWDQGDVPTNGDDVVFGAEVRASHMTANNDLAANLQVKSITFDVGGYTLTGNAIKLQDGASVKIEDGAGGTTFVKLPMALTEGLSLTAPEKTTLRVDAAVSGTGAVQKLGRGTLVLGGSVPNTFTRGLTVQQGTVQLAKTGGAVAVPASLSIQTLSKEFTPQVKLLNNEQIASDAIAIVSAGCTLDLGNSTQTLTVLNVVGGKVIGSNTAKLVLLGFSHNGQGPAGQMPSIDVALTLGSGEHNVSVSDGTLTINGPVSGATSTQLIVSGKGTLKLAGTTANTYAGTTLVKSGTLLLSKSGAKPEDRIAVPGTLTIGDAARLPAVARLGGKDQLKADATVTVNASGYFDMNSNAAKLGSLKMTGGTVSNGTLTLGGNIEATSVAGPQPGTQSQTAVIDANLILGTTTTFVVNDGPADVDLKTTRAIGGLSNQQLIKDGAGTLQFAGVAPNSYTGTTSVNNGRLQLNKSGPDNDTIPGKLLIGSDAPNASAAVVQLLDSNEIKDDAPVVVTAKGLFDLNNHSEYIGALTLNSGQVKTGTGVLSLNRILTATSVVSTEPARINGNLNLGPKEGTYQREFKVDRGPAPQDLIINAAISGQQNATLLKTGAGTLQFAGSSANTYLGLTRVKEGVLELNKDVAKAVVGGLWISAVDANPPGKVVLMGNQELAEDSNVTIEPNGQLDLNGKHQSIGSLGMGTGLVTTGPLGLLSVSRGVTGHDLSGPSKITGRILLNGKTLNVAASQGKGVSLILDVDFVGGGTIEKTGGGVAALTGNAGKPDLINVRSGTLQLSGTNGSTDVHVYGGIFEGSGTTKSIASGAQGNMAVHVGTSTKFAVLEAAHGVNFTAGTTFQVKVQGGTPPAAGVNFDQLKSGAAINLNGATLSLNLAGFKFPAKGMRFQIMECTSGAPIGGKFGNLPSNGSLMKVTVPGTTRTALFSIEYGVGAHKSAVDLVYEGEVV
jgi:autotransporter-associated beta strand protein